MSVVVLIFIVISELGLFCGLQSTGPYFPDALDRDPSVAQWMQSKRQEIFLQFFPLLGLLIMTSAVSLILGCQKNTRFFSRLGILACAGPLFASLSLWNSLLNWVRAGYFLLLPGAILSVLSTVKVIASRRNFGDLLAIPLNIAWLFFYQRYLDVWTEAFVW